MNLTQALAIINPKEKTEDGLKEAYRKACLKHHPDKGGDVEIMKLVNAAYDFLKKCESWWTGEQLRKAKSQTPLTETMQEITNKFRSISGIKIEIIGSWLWISGLTFPHKKTLRESGMKFSGNKKSWYYHEDSYRKKSKKKFSMDDIRDLHGSEQVKTKQNKSIAA